MNPQATGLGLRLLAMALLTLSSVSAQWTPPVFDAPVVYLGSARQSLGPQTQSMIEVLDMDGNGAPDFLSVRIGASGAAGSSLRAKVAEFGGNPQPQNTTGTPGTLLLDVQSQPYIPTAGSMDPASHVGRIGPDDGRDDAVLAVGSTVWVLTHPGSGIVASPEATLTAGGAVTSVRVGDFDGDGFGDIVTLTDTELTFHRWVAPGTFASTSWPLSSGSGPDLISGEFNGDGVTDVAVVGSRVDFYDASGGAFVPAGSHTVGVAGPMPDAGDVDGDGDVDIVIFGDTQYVLLRREGPATFVMEAPVTGGPATRLVDVDGDGDLDGACCGGGSGGSPEPIVHTPTTFHISINEGGVFQPAYKLPGIGGWHLAGVTDVNGDGWNDLVAGRAIYFGRQSLGTNPWEVGAVDPALHEAVADLDGDGDLDWNVSIGGVRWNDGSGRSVLTALHLLDQPPAGTSYGEPTIIGDFDGDGDADLLVEELVAGVPVGVRLLLCQGRAFQDGGPAMPSGVTLSPWTGPSPERFLVTDVDGDGDQDLISRSPGTTYWSHIWLNEGSGTFVLGSILGSEVVVAAADFNQDGRPDLLVSDGRLLLRRQLPSGDFAAAVPLTNASNYFSVYTSFNPFRDSVAIGDFDGDGDLDLVAGARNAGFAYPRVFRNEGTLPFVAEDVYGGAGLDKCNALLSVRLLAGDLDGDGYDDLIVSNPISAMYKGVGVAFGANTYGLFRNTNYQNQAHLAEIRALADVDGDGDLDGLGPSVVLNRTIEGPDVGFRKQWGAGLAGSGGIVPLLGATGPVRVGTPLELRLVGAMGQSAGLLAVGTATHSLPIAGGTQHVLPDFYLPFACGGTLGAPSDGAWTLPFGVLPPFLDGLTFHFQAGLADPGAPAGIALTNAVTLTAGH